MRFNENEMNIRKDTLLKQKIIRQARILGAGLVGFAPVSRWAEYNEVPEAYRPESVWSKTRTVIVLGVPILLPIVESTPSINYQEMYNTTNILLDQMGFRLAVFLNDLGHASVFIPRDGYGSLEILLENPFACLSHVYAGKYAGLGTIGYHHNLITPRYGPRVRLVTVLTALELKGNPVISKDLCTQCELCKRLCPSQAFTTRNDSLIADLDKEACTRHHQRLKAESRWPCGICIKVCPIGEDRKLYQNTNIKKYIVEQETLKNNPNDPAYREWVHLRRHGSKQEERNET